MRTFLFTLSLLLPLPARAATLHSFDFTRPETLRAWAADHDIAALRATSEGMAIDITGSDPFLHGPARDYPAGAPLWLSLRLRAYTPGMAQVFWFTDRQPPSEDASVRFPVSAGGWRQVRVPIPPLGPGTRLRFDPPGDSGTAVLASLAIEERTVLPEPVLPKPDLPKITDRAFSLQFGRLTVLHAPDRWGACTVGVDGMTMAAGNTRPVIGTVRTGRVRWLDVASNAKVTVTGDAHGIVAVSYTHLDVYKRQV